MPELTRTPRTEIIELTFTGPVRQKDEAILALKKFGFADTSDSIPWREAFPEYDEKNMPGICLRGARGKENITQKRLSELTGISQRHISEMENGKRPIGKKTAKILGRALNVGYKVFL
ncbi:MAG: helix-turn-helix transcriptional regulator [Desulfobacteraceae bacterium]|nr:helix-turn-helix transcriptional regulator [Desulfobacteraceae bacterium]